MFRLKVAYRVQHPLLTLSGVTILLVCPNEHRLNRLKTAVHSAGFRTIAARSLDQAWAKTYSYDFNAVVIDYELKNDIAAAAFRQPFITLNLNEDAVPEAVVMELTGNSGASKIGPETLSQWMTAGEAAAYVRTKPRTLLKWVREGSIKAWPLHGAKRRTWRFRKEDLDAALGFVGAGASGSVIFSKTSSVALQ